MSDDNSPRSVIWEVAVRTRTGLADPQGEAVQAEICRLHGPRFAAASVSMRPADTPSSAALSDTVPRVQEPWLPTGSTVRFEQVYLLSGLPARTAAEEVARELLADPVCQEFSLRDAGQAAAPSVGADTAEAEFSAGCVTVYLKPGVTDPAAGTVESALRSRGYTEAGVRTARRYRFSPAPPTETLREIARRVLANDCIETVAVGLAVPPPIHTERYRFHLRTVALRDKSDAALMELSARGHLSLTLAEMQAIRAHYTRLGRDPTDVELESLAQTWSEHCVHKTLKGLIRYRERQPDGSLREEVIDNLLASTIAAATHRLARPWCVSVFRDNAGVIAFDEHYAVTFKVETHNRPSAIEPYGGAATGIGGCIRDTMGTGLGAKPIASTDVFCFAPPDLPAEQIPPGALPPERVIRGVVAGVRDYGNRMGIPTVNGAVFFDARYVGNPLVFCGSVGLIPLSMTTKAAAPGDRIFVVGGRTGRDGIHGATFSSAELNAQSETVFSHAVQIGNAITQKRLLDALLAARDAGLYTAVTDCGAGGLSSAVGEMGESLGATVHLERVPLKYEGLRYDEIWISEAQERMVLAVPPRNADRLREVFTSEGVEAADIGEFGTLNTAQGQSRPELLLLYEGHLVGRLDMAFLHRGLPRLQRDAIWEPPPRSEPSPALLDQRRSEQYRRPSPAASPSAPGKAVPPFNAVLTDLLSGWNVCSKEWFIRQYDHEVQGGSVLKPLVGDREDGPGDAAVIRPRLGSRRGIALGVGMNPCLGDLDPYYMATAAVDEALRNVVAVGADPAHTAILDNFSWGRCDLPDRLGGLVRAARGCHDAALAFGTPFISGKDSLNNEFALPDGRTICIPPSLLISAIGIVPDVFRCVSSDAKAAGNLLYIVGTTRDELGGSQYYRLLGELGANVPRVDLSSAPAILRAVHAAISAGLVRSCHDLSEGGLSVALAEMCFAGGFGAAVDLRTLPSECSASGTLRADQLLFSESPTRFLLEVEPARGAALSAALAGITHACVGRLEHEPWLVVHGHAGETLIEAELSVLKSAWQAPFRW